jgi:hypothetical protein
LTDGLNALDCSDWHFRDAVDEIFPIIKSIKRELHPRRGRVRRPRPRKGLKPVIMAAKGRGWLVMVVDEFQASMRESARKLMSMSNRSVSTT